ncbi:hypothetical protein [Actinokineospora sp. HUAS TT18]|uniref:hypothetical protein n=1 Tax=Actinokineospora sp. HUAS TT18 TaxID=3447451 RepID=UPI003F52188F
MRLPAELRLPAAKAAGAAVFSILVAILISLTGALGLWSLSEAVWRTQATVVTSAPCGAGQTEEVTFQRDGQEQRASLDACGHLRGETIEIAVGDTVSVARATAGAQTDARPLGVILCVFAGIAGAGFAELYRRPGGP